MAGLYNFPTWRATNQTIGILEFSGPAPNAPTCGFALNDVQLFMAALGPQFTVPVITSVSVDGAANTESGNALNIGSGPLGPDFEVALDIQVAASVAQGANLAVYFAPNTEQGWVDAVNAAIHDVTNGPSVLSISWGGAESTWTGSGISNISAAFQEAAALGVTVFIASGDNGSNSFVNHGSAHVNYPASDPWATACGGTFTANVVGSSFNQGTWNDATGATSGGVSDVFPLPSWQAGAGVPLSVNAGNRQGRGVPDVAGNASGFSGYLLDIYGQVVTALQVSSGSKAGSFLGAVGGTSAVAPLYAALTALINADLGGPLVTSTRRCMRSAGPPGRRSSPTSPTARTIPCHSAAKSDHRNVPRLRVGRRMGRLHGMGRH